MEDTYSITNTIAVLTETLKVVIDFTNRGYTTDEDLKNQIIDKLKQYIAKLD